MKNSFANNKRVLEEGIDTTSAKAGERGDIGLLEVIESDFSFRSAHLKSLRNSSGVSSHADCSLLALPSAPACALAASTHATRSAPSSAAVRLFMRGGETPVHVALNSGGTGGLLPVQRSTSYCLNVSSQGPTRRRWYQRWGFQSGRRFAPCLRR